MFKTINKLIQLLVQSKHQTIEDLKPEELANKEIKEVVSSVVPSEKTISEPLPIEEKFNQSKEKSIQEKIDSLPNKSILELWPPNGEYAGPIVINRPMELRGRGATIWALKGPVLSIQSDDVSLNDLRIEITGEKNESIEEQCAVIVQTGKNLQLNNLEVRGLVMGLSSEEGNWKYPPSLNLGQLAYGKEYNFMLRIVVPIDCQITTSISGLELKPSQLTSGCHSIGLHIEKLPEDTLINGAIFLVSSSFKRRISFTAHIVSLKIDDEQIVSSQNNVIWEPSDWSSFVPVKKENSLSYETESDVIALSNLSLSEPPKNINLSPTESNPSTSKQQSKLSSQQSSKIRRGEQPNQTLLNVPSNQLSAKSNPTEKIEQPQISNLFSQKQKNIKNEVKAKTKTESKDKSPSLPSVFSEQVEQSKLTISSQEKKSEDSQVFSSAQNNQSQSINPLFEQASLSHQTSNQSDDEKLPESRPEQTKTSGLHSSKRKIVRPTQNISPLFNKNVQVKHLDEKE